jgi:fibronectin type 3 domain-containing protein/alpha-tubulin suppressor-like RCC1 family protein
VEKCKKRAVLVLISLCLAICTILSPLLSDSAAAVVSVSPKVSCGLDHTLALRYDGTVYAWGYNSSGQLGDGTKNYSSTPLKVPVSGIVDIAGGGAHSLALKSDGTISAWGSNTYGQLGNTNNLSGVIAIAAGKYFSTALKNDGTVWAWGNNDYGQLGDGTYIQNTNPVQVKDLTGVIAISCGYNHVLALKNDGTVWAWGNNNSGQLGNGTGTKSNIPVQVICPPLYATGGGTKLMGITSISAGGYNSTAIKNDGTLWAWGDNTYGQSGQHLTNQCVAEAVDTNSFSYSKASCGAYYTLYLDSGKSLSSKGRNTYGQLGIGTNSDTSSETPIPLYSDAVDISAGCFHGVSLMSDGSLWSWGRNDFGQLGDGTLTNRNQPVRVKNLILTDTTVPATPTQLIAKPGDGKVSLSWSTVQGAAYYTVRRATTSGGRYYPVTSELTTSTTYEDTTVTNGTKYYYIVTATSSSNIESLASSEVSATPSVQPLRPTGLSAFAGTNMISLSWNQVSNAVSYSLKRATTSGGPYSTITDTLSCGYTDTRVTNGTKYYYKVTATSSFGVESLPSLEVSATSIAPVRPLSPTGLTAVVGDNKVSLSWGQVSTAVCYNLKRSTTPGGPYSFIAVNLHTTAYEDTTVTNGTSYYYVVTATSSLALDSLNSTEVSAVPNKPVAPTSPTNLKATAGDRLVNLSWDPSPSIPTPKYTIKRATSLNGPYETVATNWTATKLTTSGLTNNITYYHIVIAENINGTSEPSNAVAATPAATPSAPTGLVAVAGDRKVNLSFSASEGAAYYSIKRATTAGGPYTNIISNLTSTSYQDTAVTNGIIYYYVVTAISSVGGESSVSVKVSATPIAPIPSAPTGLVAAAGDRKVDLSFSASEGAAYYSIKRATTAGGPYTNIISNLTSTSYQDTTVTNGIMYYYIVTASSTGGESLASIEVSATPIVPTPTAPLPPTNLRVTIRNDSIFLQWNASPSTPTPEYTVKKSTSPDGPYETVVTHWAGTSLVTNALANNTTYYLIVIAENSNGTSEPSNVLKTTLLAPIPSAPINLAVVAGDGKVDLSFSASQGADYYSIKRAMNAGGPYTNIASNLATTSYKDTTVINATTYFYIVTASSTGGESLASNEVSATPMVATSTNPLAPLPPTNIQASAGDGSISLSWNASPSTPVPQYTIKRSTNLDGPYETVVTHWAGTNLVTAGLPNNITYYHIVIAENSNGTSEPSNTVAATPMALAFLAPTNLVATTGDGKVDLSFSALQGASYYSIKRATSEGGPYTNITANLTTTSYQDTTVTNGTLYYYIVIATSIKGEESLASNEVSATPVVSPLAPSSPTNLQATIENGSIRFEWEPSPSPNVVYTIKRSTTPGGIYKTFTTGYIQPYVTIYESDTTTYYYVVTAVNSNGESQPSNEVSAAQILYTAP